VLEETMTLAQEKEPIRHRPT